jgi:hypothetical protein
MALKKIKIIKSMRHNWLIEHECVTSSRLSPIKAISKRFPLRSKNLDEFSA